MLKTLAALGLISALAFAPVAALADDTAPAAPAADSTAPATDAKPMKPMKHHMMKHHMKKKMEEPKADESAPK